MAIDGNTIKLVGDLLNALVMVLAGIGGFGTPLQQVGLNKAKKDNNQLATELDALKQQINELKRNNVDVAEAMAQTRADIATLCKGLQGVEDAVKQLHVDVTGLGKTLVEAILKNGRP